MFFKCIKLLVIDSYAHQECSIWIEDKRGDHSEDCGSDDENGKEQIPSINNWNITHSFIVRFELRLKVFIVIQYSINFTETFILKYPWNTTVIPKQVPERKILFPEGVCQSRRVIIQSGRSVLVTHRTQLLQSIFRSITVSRVFHRTLILSTMVGVVVNPVV